LSDGGRVIGGPRVVRTIALRSVLFLVMLAVSIPLAYPVGLWLLGLIPPLNVPQNAFWHLVDDLVFDMPVKWPFVAFAPVDLVMETKPGGLWQWVALSCLGWAPIAVLYGWVTRRLRLSYAILGVYPAIWAVGITIALLVDAIGASSFDSSDLP
jgi:hypothetical protein